MRLICFLAIFSAGVARAGNLDSIEASTKAALSETATAQINLGRLFEDKLGLDWGLTKDAIAAATDTLQQAHYSVEFPRNADCNPYAEALAANAAYATALENQANEVVRFLEDYHFRVLGKNLSHFKIRRVVVCTASRWWKLPSLTFDRMKSELTVWIGPSSLYAVGPSFLRRDNLNPLTSAQIRAKWDAGEQWQLNTAIRDRIDHAKNPVRAYWNFLNPVGEIRTLLREVFRRAGVEANRRFAGVDILTTIIRLGLPQALATAVGQVEAEKQSQLTSRWRQKLIDPGAAENMGVASLSAVLKKRMERQRQLNIDRTQIGFVNVENFHHIDVGFATGEVQDFEEYVTVPDTLDISVTQVGLVNVSTTDRVEVNVALAALSSGSHFDKAVLKSVLKEAGL